MSGYFYAIGGANYDKKESLTIDLDIIEEAKKKNPNVLLISAANNYDISKINNFKFYYESLGANVTLLKPDINDINELNELFNNTDIIYILGGITSRLLEYAKGINLHNLLINAYNVGKIIVGVSAGAILFFDYGFGDKDAYQFNLETVNHKITNGLGIFKGVFCPHYQNSGLITFNEKIKNYNLNGFALENGAALKIFQEGFKVVRNKGCSAFMFDKEKNHQLIYLNEKMTYNIKLFK